MNPGAPTAETTVAIENRGAVLEAGEAEQVALRGTLAAPRATSDGLCQESSASPVGGPTDSTDSALSGSPSGG
jgi:hypothetical protein